MFVAATTDCFSHLSFDESVEKIVDLEFTNLEINIDENGDHLKPSQVADDVTAAIARCSATRRLNVISYRVVSHAQGEQYYDEFQAICDLANAMPKSSDIPITSPVESISGPSRVSMPGNFRNGNTASLTEK